MYYNRIHERSFGRRIGRFCFEDTKEDRFRKSYFIMIKPTKIKFTQGQCLTVMRTKMKEGTKTESLLEQREKHKHKCKYVAAIQKMGGVSETE